MWIFDQANIPRNISQYATFQLEKYANIEIESTDQNLYAVTGYYFNGDYDHIWAGSREQCGIVYNRLCSLLKVQKLNIAMGEIKDVSN